MQYWRSLAERVGSTRLWRRGVADRALGVDLGAASAKWVDLSIGRPVPAHPQRRPDGPARRRWRLEAAAVVPWPTQAQTPAAACMDAEGHIADMDAVVSALRPLVAQQGWRGREVVTAMPAAGVTVRRLQVPSGLGERDLELEVQVQAEALLPQSLSQSHLDYVIEADGQVRLVAAPRAAVDARCEALEQAGVRVVAVDLASDALRRVARRALRTMLTAPHTRNDSVCALIDIGLHTARIQVLWGERVLHEREQAGLGALSLQGMTVEAAAQALSGALALFVDGRVHGLQNILLCGALASRPGLTHAMQVCNLCTCEALAPFTGFEYADTVDRVWLHPHAPGLSAACGLALHAGPGEAAPEGSA